MKRVTANLGELLCVASVCSATWEDLAASVLEEVPPEAGTRWNVLNWNLF